MTLSVIHSSSLLLKILFSILFFFFLSFFHSSRSLLTYTLIGISKIHVLYLVMVSTNKYRTYTLCFVNDVKIKVILIKILTFSNTILYPIQPWKFRNDCNENTFEFKIHFVYYTFRLWIPHADALKTKRKNFYSSVLAFCKQMFFFVCTFTVLCIHMHAHTVSVNSGIALWFFDWGFPVERRRKKRKCKYKNS